MCASIRMITFLLLAVPPAFLVAAAVGLTQLYLHAFLVISVYAWIWLRFRPSQFVVHQGGIDVRWPVKRRVIPRKEIVSVRLMDPKQLKKEIGWGMRVGAGGLWGGFGWLLTKRRGLVQMYVSRTDGYVWIERSGKRPWLITPEQPEAFIGEFSS